MDSREEWKTVVGSLLFLFHINDLDKEIKY